MTACPIWTQSNCPFSCIFSQRQMPHFNYFHRPFYFFPLPLNLFICYYFCLKQPSLCFSFGFFLPSLQVSEGILWVNCLHADHPTLVVPFHCIRFFCRTNHQLLEIGSVTGNALCPRFSVRRR